MGSNLTLRILEQHRVGADLAPGAEVGLRVDQALLQDATGTMACLEYLEVRDARVCVPLAVQYVDHNVIQLDFKNPDDHRFLQTFWRCSRSGSNLEQGPPEQRRTRVLMFDAIGGARCDEDSGEGGRSGRPRKK